MRSLLLVLLLTTPSLAAPTLHARNGQTIRVLVGDKRETGIGLRPVSGSWRLELARTQADRAEVIDVTAGVSGMKWQVTLEDGALRFDERFRADHAYRVTLTQGTKSVGAALVYLYPPKVAARQRVQFDDSDSSPEGEMATIPKPTL